VFWACAFVCAFVCALMYVWIRGGGEEREKRRGQFRERTKRQRHPFPIRNGSPDGLARRSLGDREESPLDLDEVAVTALAAMRGYPIFAVGLAGVGICASLLATTACPCKNFVIFMKKVRLH
jgi:hypothetical protein